MGQRTTQRGPLPLQPGERTSAAGVLSRRTLSSRSEVMLERERVSLKEPSGVRLCSRLAVYPVQVLEDEDEGLIEALAQEELFERVKRAASAYLGVHLLQAGLGVCDTEESE